MLRGIVALSDPTLQVSQNLNYYVFEFHVGVSFSSFYKRYFSFEDESSVQIA